MAGGLRTGKLFPIGFHIGPGGNQDGLTENFLRPLDAAGIRFMIMSADAYPFDAAQLAKASGIKHTIIWRPTSASYPGIDVPLKGYGQEPVASANEHYEATLTVIPPELDKDIVNIGFLNEIDKNESSWLGFFAQQWTKNALADGYMPAGLGWSSGEPELSHWKTPGMAGYLRLVAQHIDRALVMIHEYSYETSDILRWYPSLVGRYRLLMQACDDLGIARVPFAITEWGWEYQDVPDMAKGLQDMDLLAKEYVGLQENYGAASWYLGPEFGGIANQLQPYIKPLGKLALGWAYYIIWEDSGEPPVEPPVEPPTGDSMLKNGSFEEGTYKWGGIDELNIPNEWDWAHSTSSDPNPVDPNPWSEFRQPEVVVPGKANLPPHEHDLFILDGDKTLKVFKGGGAIKFRLSQQVYLEPGTYALSLPIYADLVKGYGNDGQKIWADDPGKRDGLYKFLIDGPSTGEWQSLNPGAWNNVSTLVKIVSAGPVTVGIEIMLPFALAQNGIFADAWTLELQDETEPPVEPPPGDCIPTDANTRHHILRPMNMTREQWNFLHNKMTTGLQLPEIGHVIVGYEGWTHTDSMDAIKKAVAAGFTDSRLIVMDGDQIGSGLDQTWMRDNCPLLLPYTVWISSTAGVPGPFEFKSWPTTGTPYVTQYFGANPQNYIDFGLPGHDGVDIRAPEGAPILAVADGEIYRIETNPGASNYGIHVRIRHQDGYKTIYAHFSRLPSGLFLGKQVKAGELIGYSGNTGNSFGAHLHLGLKREGHTFTDENGKVWPWNLHDPTPFLEPFCPPCFPNEPPPAGAGEARLGLHASADPGLASGEVDMFGTAKIDLIKILSNLPPQHCTALANKRPHANFVIRVFQDGWDRPGGISPTQFIDWNTSDVVRYIPLLDGRSVYIELHNEPNLVQEGWTHSWQDGHGFSNWLLPVIADFRKTFPGKRLVFPGLSPGGDVSGIRYDSYRFVQEAAQAVALCDVLGVHIYWQKDHWPMNMALDQLDAYRRLFPDKPILITESSNNRATTSQHDKGVEYIQFWDELRRRLEVIGVTYFVASASNAGWGWNGGTGETWLGTDIPGVVGNR